MDEQNNYWNASMPAKVMKREAMPGIERLQTTYVRYDVSGVEDARPTFTGWQVNHSKLQYPSSDPTAADMGASPTSISMRIVTAPAEFAVPVKQDKRLTPDFRVRLEVRYRQQLNWGMQLRAHVISQEEFDNMNSWLPDYACLDGRRERRSPTELKGTTVVEHMFSVASSNGDTASTSTLQHGDMHANDALSFNGHTPMHAASNNHAANHHLPQSGYTTLDQHLTGNNGGYPTMMSDVNMAAVDNDKLRSADLYEMCQALLGVTPSQELPTADQAMFSAEDLMALRNSANFDNLLDQFPQDFDQAMPLQMDGGSTAVDVKPTTSRKVVMSGAPVVETATSADAEGLVVQDFDFPCIEFMKPTRMNKVYMVFSCFILNSDLLYCVYSVPTIGICRAEQKKKAYQKLGVPFTDGGDAASIQPAAGPSGANELQLGGRKRSSNQSGCTDNDSDLRGSKMYEPFSAADERPVSSMLVHPGEVPPHSRAALREWILEEYDRTCLGRRLTEQDLRALESQAGFPPDAAQLANVVISREQWQDFQESFRAVLLLLRRIQPLWKHEDPCIVSGFDMDRRMALQALVREPAGTFICRFSMSQPGCLVMTCKVSPGTPNADNDNLIHALIRVDDLQERRVDTWIRDFPGATHVLDVYKNKRVDKRKVFASHYTRLRHLESFDG